MSDLGTLRDHRNDHGRLIHPDDGQVYACPCCDAAAPRLRERLKNASVGGDARLCCPDCKTGFDADAVVVRERRHGGGSGLSGTPAVLARTDADAVLPDGGTTYVRPTGEGYQTVVSVREHATAIQLTTLPVDWPPGTAVRATPAAGGVRLTTDAVEAQLGGDTRVTNPAGDQTQVTVPAAAIGQLRLGDGDDLRVYDADAPGLLLVDADADPRVEGGEA
jgi:hypothetical protein